MGARPARRPISIALVKPAVKVAHATIEQLVERTGLDEAACRKALRLLLAQGLRHDPASDRYRVKARTLKRVLRRGRKRYPNTTKTTREQQ